MSGIVHLSPNSMFHYIVMAAFLLMKMYDITDRVFIQYNLAVEQEKSADRDIFILPNIQDLLLKKKQGKQCIIAYL